MVARSLCPTPVKPTTAELALSQYFKINITPFSADEFLEPFWSYSVPLATHSLTPLFHASNAVAGLVWSRTPSARLSPVAATEIYAESAKQYSVSTKQILKLTQIPSPSAQDKTTVLLANVLLILYAFEIGDVETAAGINSRSWQLIRYWKFWECTATPGIADMATQVLYFFIRASSFQMSQTQRGRKVAEAWGDAVAWLQQSPLISTTRAYLEIEMIWIGIWTRTSNVTQRKIDLTVAQNARSILCGQLKIWESRYDAMPSSMLLAAPIHTTVLEAHRILIKIVLQATLVNLENEWDETCWDKFDDEYRRALQIIQLGLGQGTEAKTRDGGNWTPGDTGFTQSLYKALHNITKSCRNPKTRRQAATTLQTSLRAGLSKLPPKSRHGLAKYCAIYFIIDDIISLEEAAWNDPDRKDDCTGEKMSVNAVYVCNRHRIASVEMIRKADQPPEVMLVTIGDILDNRLGHKLRMPVIHAE